MYVYVFIQMYGDTMTSTIPQSMHGFMGACYLYWVCATVMAMLAPAVPCSTSTPGPCSMIQFGLLITRPKPVDKHSFLSLLGH